MSENELKSVPAPEAEAAAPRTKEVIQAEYNNFAALSGHKDYQADVLKAEAMMLRQKMHALNQEKVADVVSEVAENVSA